MDTHACICCPLLLNLVKTLTPENIKRLNGKVKKGFFLFLSLKSSNFSFLPWPFPQSVSNNYTPTPPPHLPPLCFGFPSWRFSSVPSFLGPHIWIIFINAFYTWDVVRTKWVYIGPTFLITDCFFFFLTLTWHWAINVAKAVYINCQVAI